MMRGLFWPTLAGQRPGRECKESQTALAVQGTRSPKVHNTNMESDAEAVRGI